MDKILIDVLKNRPFYVHAIEVGSVWELQSVIDNFIEQDNMKYTLEEYLDFFNSIELYCTDEDNDDEVYTADIESLVNQAYMNYC